MREIKFRAWDKTNKSMCFFDLNVCNQESMDWWTNEVQGNHIMQYIGLKDKYETAIYEGDIIKQTISDFHNTFIVVGEIIYSRDSFLLNDIKNETLHTIMSHCEVIGNIYENIELLGKTNE